MPAFDPRWLTTAGLIVDIVGTWWLAWGLFISKKGAAELTQAVYGEVLEEDPLSVPAVRDRLRQSRNAKIGVVVLIAGFLLQVAGMWVRAG